ncbi:MAG TPA: Gfo/Idh/MocA family oxidoreductase [Acidimicrobiales bacterium]|nr:Gfo/Idh/MocA family oxidoreductase [Acidimicrobiales bacterium]
MAGNQPTGGQPRNDHRNSDRARLRIALVGAGAMGSLHARVAGQHSQVELAAIVDIDETAGRALAGRFDCPYRSDLDSGAYDAVIVASPTDTHHDWVSHALDSGLPVLVEKPMALDLAGARSMVERAAALDIPITCGFVERWNAAIMLAIEIVKEPVYLQAFRHSPYVARIRGGITGDLLIHDVDLALRFFGGSPTQVQAHLGFFHPQSEPGAEDVAEAQLTFAGGGLATVSASRIGQQKVRQVRVHDLNRMLEIDLVRQDVTVFRHVGNEFEDSGAYRQQTVIDIPVIANRREPLLAQLDHFVALIDGQVDHAAERATLLPPHEVIDRVLTYGRKAGR